MKVTTLVEDTSNSNDLKSEHGLSLYIETKNNRILFDTGASDLLLENAKKLGVDLSTVNIVVISHGHDDHGGGINAFLKENSKANIYFNRNAFSDYYSTKLNEKQYIGLDKGLYPNNRFIFIDGYLKINKELELFSDIKGARFIPRSNSNLLMKVENNYLPDNFSHEQSLLINVDGKMVLVAGCAHNGIINIIEHISERKNVPIDFVIGGFHLHSSSSKRNEDVSIVNQIGEYLLETGSTYYTGHCTGLEPYRCLRSIMGDKVNYLSTGSIITI